jgi:hypothetical protein
VTEFSQKESLSAKSRTKIASYLRDIGDEEAALRFTPSGGGGQGFMAKMLGMDQYAHTGILLGYIEPAAGAGLIPIQNALTISADAALKDSRIKITLDKVFVQNFPGTGTHEILCEFTGKNQIEGEAEEMRFALTTTANDGSGAAISGAPIFLGVSVGKNGIAFEGRLINVKSSSDAGLMDALGSDVFKNGLSLLTSVQPALKPFVGLAGSVVKAVAARSENCQVYAFRLGLDFGNGSTSACLKYGSYVVVQADADSWDWTKLSWNPDSQLIVNQADGQRIELNYIVVGVSAFEG